MSFGVILAKAGIQCFQILLDACLRRHDGISDFLRVRQHSLFDIRFFRVSFPIKLVAPAACGSADT
jgi:hypothetical protein